VVIAEQLVPRFKMERPEDRVHRGRGIRDEREALRVAAQEPSDLGSCQIEENGKVAVQEPNGFELHRVPERLLLRQDRFRAGAERPVVQERDGRVQPPAEVRLHPDMMRRRTDAGSARSAA